MSEYQRIVFRAIDGPVSEANLEFMHEQSSRAEITPWEFDNEYHYSDFRGNAVEMLRRGYDFHLHYANFGIRKLMFRLPAGLPHPKDAKAYLDEEGLTFIKDKRGPGGALCLEPYLEPGEIDDLWNVDEFIERLLPLRAEILAGDLRPLYLAHLVVKSDGNHDPEEEETEAPVPAGLKKLTKAQHALMEFYELSVALVAAAAKQSPPLPKPQDQGNQYEAWLRQQPEARKTAWLAQLMADPHSAVRREILAEFQQSQDNPAWATARANRTINELQEAAEGIADQRERAAEKRAAQKRAQRLEEMAANPKSFLRQTEELVQQRGRSAYEEIATLLADLREALQGTRQAGLAEQQARKLKDQNPTLNVLTRALRAQGFLLK